MGNANHFRGRTGYVRTSLSGRSRSRSAHVPLTNRSRWDRWADAGLAFPSDPRRCRLCTFSHVCMNGTHAHFPIKNAAERAAADAVLNDCTLPKAQMGGRKRPAICNCFMKGITLAFVEYAHATLRLACPHGADVGRAAVLSYRGRCT